MTRRAIARYKHRMPRLIASRIAFPLTLVAFLLIGTTSSASTAPQGDVPAARPAVAPNGVESLDGAWVSSETAPVDPQNPAPPYVLLAFERGAGGAWGMRLWMPAAMALGEPVSSPKVEDDGRFSGSWRGRGISMELSGSIDASSRTIALHLDVEQRGAEKEFDLVLSPTRLVSTVPEARRYTAELDAMGMKLPMSITLGDAGDLGWVGAIDIPMQGILDMPLRVQRSEAGVVARIPVGLPATITLEEKDDGAVLEGTFVQGPINAPIVFKRSSDPVRGMSRPQEPRPPFPYATRDVRVPTPMGHELAGTLTLPEGASSKRRVPGVVLLSGSGLQDRDETLMGHKPFLVLADALTRAGVAVLRCDDRGVGSSGGDGAKATLRDFADDGRAMMAFLRSQPEIDGARCGYIGHSEGGVTGPLAAQLDQEAGVPVAFVVSLAGSAVTGAELLPVQMRRILAALGTDQETIDAIGAAQRKALESIVAGQPREEVVARVLELLDAQRKALAAQRGMAAPPALTADAPEVMMALAQLDSPWMRDFLTYDPAPALRSVRAPLLAMNGDLDTQVDTAQNLVRIEAIRREAGLPVTTRHYATLNHLFQPAMSGGVDEYALIETTFDPKALSDLVAWVAETTKAAPKVPATPAAPAARPAPAAPPAPTAR